MAHGRGTVSAVEPAAELAALRTAFGPDAGVRPALGWAAVREFGAPHDVLLPQPWRSFGAEFGYACAAPGFAGWVRHWAAGRPWCDLA